MIIFGSQRRVRRMAMLYRFCGTCNAPYAASLNKGVTKFTVFFVPLFPIYVKHSITCTWCGTTSRVSKPDAERFRQQAQAPQQSPHPQSHPDQQSHPDPQQGHAPYPGRIPRQPYVPQQGPAPQARIPQQGQRRT